MSASRASQRPRPAATMADLDALPTNVKGEILDGVLYAHARPRSSHAHIVLVLGAELHNPYERARGGPGGWWILPEPGMELPNSFEVSPDLAGWRKERLPRLLKSKSITVVPDWVCEVLSPSTRRYDLVTKRRFYARHGVPYLWYIDPESRTLHANKLDSGRWIELGVFEEGEKVKIAPFEEIELDIGDLWTGLEPEETEE